MIRFVLLIFFGLYSIPGVGSSVLWDAFTLVHDNVDGDSIELNSNGFDVSFYIAGYGSRIVAEANTSRQGTAAPISTYVSGAWLMALAGDVVDYSTMLNQSEYFFNELHGTSFPYVQTPVDVAEGGSQYFKFVLQDFDEAYAYLTGEAQSIPSLYYGWMEYSYDQNGFKILRSAIGLDGQVVLVGSIPEPTSGLLILVGIAALALKRTGEAMRELPSIGLKKLALCASILFASMFARGSSVEWNPYVMLQVGEYPIIGYAGTQTYSDSSLSFTLLTVGYTI